MSCTHFIPEKYSNIGIPVIERLTNISALPVHPLN